MYIEDFFNSKTWIYFHSMWFLIKKISADIENNWYKVFSNEVLHVKQEYDW